MAAVRARDRGAFCERGGGFGTVDWDGASCGDEEEESGDGCDGELHGCRSNLNE